jgi:hypothetical protein
MSQEQQTETTEEQADQAFRVWRTFRLAHDGMFSDAEAKAIVERVDRMADHYEVRLAVDDLAVSLTRNGYDSALIYMFLNSCAPAFQALREGRAILHGD